MPFPEVQRVNYQINPLTRVVCQLRFPPILKIDTEVPAKFQDMIRHDWPNFTQKQEVLANIPAGVLDGMTGDILTSLLRAPAISNYQFDSEDEDWKVNLTRTFLALSTTDYQRWEDFLKRLLPPIDALVITYTPSKYVRIGLRYTNVIQRSRLGLADVPWTELLQTHVLGMLSSPEAGNHVSSFSCKYVVDLEDGESKARIETSFVKPDGGDETCYRIDNDFYFDGNASVASVLEKLEYLRTRGSRLFRWCITDRLHNAMKPEAI